MKNSLLFCGHNDSKRGGMADFVGDFDSLWDAQQYIEDHKNQRDLLKTLPALQWAHIYNVDEASIVVSGTIEIWQESDIGNGENDPTTIFKWNPYNSDLNYQPLLTQISVDSDKAELAEKQQIQEKTQQAQELSDISAQLDNVVVRIVEVDLGVVDPAYEGSNIFLQCSFNAVAMAQEIEMTTRHIRILDLDFDGEETAYILSVGGMTAISQLKADVLEYYSDDAMLVDLFMNVVLTDEEVAQINA